MNHPNAFHVIAPALLLSALACRTSPHETNVNPQTTIAMPPTPLVLELENGERRVRRTEGGGAAAPFILKVDARNGGSRDLVMGYETIQPGRTIAPHRHLLADEIIFIHAGSGVADLGDHSTPFGTGATIYIPKNVRVSVHNTGPGPMLIAFFFSKPGFEAYLRDTSVPEGQPVTPLTRAELTAIRARHQTHTVYENP